MPPSINGIHIMELRADTPKDKLWAIATWLLVIASRLLAFIFSQKLVLFAPAGLSARQGLPGLALACAGILVCLFSFLVIDDYGKHIQRNWDRAGVPKPRARRWGRFESCKQEEWRVDLLPDFSVEEVPMVNRTFRNSGHAVLGPLW
jgi:hypothetical protein